jgi:hypothetical protein
MRDRLVRLASAARRASLAAQDTRAARDEAIGDAEEDGWTLPTIAAVVGLAVSQVGRIVVEQTRRRQERGAPARLSQSD